MDEYRTFQGLGVALVTPFNPDGSVDCCSVSRLVEYQIAHGVDFFVLNGSTGESSCIYKEERAKIIDCVYEITGGRVPIVMGQGSNDTNRVVERIQTMDKSRVDGILSVVPYYNKPTQEGIYRHFKTFAEACPLPIILYNIPGRTGANMCAETTLRLARQCPNIVGLKEAGNDMNIVSEVVNGLQRTDFRVLSGDDGHALAHIEQGAQGVISVIGNALPLTFGKMVHAAMNGDWDTAKTLESRLTRLNTLLFKEGNPSGIKTLLYQMMLINHNILRMPLLPCTPMLQKEIGAELKSLEQVLEDISVRK